MSQQIDDIRTRIASMAPRSIVVALAVSTLVGWLLGISGAMRLPSLGFVALDLALDVLVLAGLWFLWRPAWVFALALTLLGETTLAIHPRAHAALLIIGAVQLGLLLLPQLRRHLRTRSMSAALLESSGQGVDLSERG